MNKVIFKPFSSYPRGIIYKMLIDSYASQTDIINQEKQSWKNYDNDVFSNLDTIGRCGFISIIDNKPIGFASWDPRNKPDFAVIGHNCILPEYQKKGFGKAQINEVLRKLKKLGFNKVRASTGAKSFFGPAQKMYKSCGFKEIKRTQHDTMPDFEVVYFEKKL